MQSHLRTLMITGFLLMTTGVFAENGPDFNRDIAPLLNKYCAGCHNDADREGKFSLQSFASLQKGTEKGPAFLPGDPAGSLMIRLLTSKSDNRMPPEGEPAPSEADIELLKKWIEAGATGPAGEAPDRLQLIVPQIASQTDKQPIAAIDVGAGGTSVAVARYGEVEILRELRVSDPQTGKKKRELQVVQKLTGFPGKVTSVHYRGASTLITTSGVTGLGGVAAIWEWPLNRKVAEFKGHLDIMLDAEISPDGNIVATCSYDKQIILWNAKTGETLRTLDGHNGAVYDVAFSPDSQFLVSASADDTCKVWRVSDGERMDTLGQPLKEEYAVLVSPDGKQIVAGGADNRIRVWDFISKDRPRINPQLVARFAHEGSILAMRYTPDGSKLVSVAEDRTIKVWDTKSWEEIQLIENEPEVAMALAVVDDTGFLVGRLDGTMQEHAIKRSRKSQAPTSDDQHTAISAAGESLPMNSVREAEPNGRPDQAMPVQIPVQIQGVISGQESGQPDRDLFRFSARASEEWVIEVNAARSNSPLDSFIEVLSSDGERIERVVLQAVRDSYFTFRGKDANESGDFRVFNWEEMDLDQYLYANGEVVRLWLYPRGPDSGYLVYPGSGKRWGYFDTTPLAHALGEPCYIVQPCLPGTELVPNGLPVFTLHYENDDESHRELGADSKLYFTAPADGDYLVRIRDVRGLQGENFSYTLNIRPRKPDFQVTIHDRDPKVNAGSAREFRVTVKRIDDFEGPVRIDISDVPAGFDVTTPILVQEGQIEAYGVISAAADAVAPNPEVAKATKITASAVVRGQNITHDIMNLGEIKLEGKPQITARIVPAPGGVQPLNAGGDGPLEFPIYPGETIMLKVIVDRGDYKGLVNFGKEDSGRNLPFGVIVDNIGLNGLMLLEEQSEREFFLTASKWVPAQKRLFHLKTAEAGAQATLPVILTVQEAPRKDVATSPR